MYEVEHLADEMTWEEVEEIRKSNFSHSYYMAISGLKVFKEKVRLLEEMNKLEEEKQNLKVMYDELSRI